MIWDSDVSCIGQWANMTWSHQFSVARIASWFLRNIPRLRSNTFAGSNHAQLCWKFTIPKTNRSDRMHPFKILFSSQYSCNQFTCSVYWTAINVFILKTDFIVSCLPVVWTVLLCLDRKAVDQVVLNSIRFTHQMTFLGNSDVFANFSLKRIKNLSPIRVHEKKTKRLVCYSINQPNEVTHKKEKNILHHFPLLSGSI